ncbi:MAG: cobalamin ABC transporter substrate-binding protein [Polyangiaceae bacterium]
MTNSPAFALRAPLSLLALSVLVACGSEPATPPTALPPYEGQQQVLFDDNIDPAAVGLAMEGVMPAQDPMLRSRAIDADVTARMRVQTVTRDSVGAKTIYTINLQVGQPTLMPAELDQQTFELRVDQECRAFGLIQSMENQLRAKTFIGFVRRFAGEGAPEIHWHLTADTPEVAQVIAEIAVLEEVAGQDAP